MAVTKDSSSKRGDKKPKHGMDKNRPNKDTGNMRSAATVRRLKMYNSGRAVRDRKGKFVSQDLQSKELPSTRIVPDRRWFGNTRVVGQKQLQSFREQLAGKADNPFAVLLRQRKLPLQLLEDPEEKTAGKRARKDVLRQFSFSETFGAKSGQRQKKPRLSAEDLGSMLELAHSAEEQYVGRAGHAGEADAYANKDEHDFAAVRQKYLDKGQSKRIWAELYKVIDSSDVVIEVLDARDPEGTRCKFLEAHLRKNHKDKHLILILNKVDLVPPWVTKKWLRVLSSEFPVLAFRAGLQHPFGMGALLSLLRQIARLRSDKKTVSVGFIGYPNVGKSSVINTLRRKKVCTVAPVPGETKVWQYITLMKRVFLIDCPGVVYAGDPSNSDDAATVLKGVVRIERLEDAAAYIPALMERVKPEYLKRAYKLEEWDGPMDFLEQVARGAGKLTRGAEPDTSTAAKMVLLDWQRGRLPFFKLPPGCSEDAPQRAPEAALEDAPVEAEAPSQDAQAGSADAGPAAAAAGTLNASKGKKETQGSGQESPHDDQGLDAQDDEDPDEPEMDADEVPEATAADVKRVAAAAAGAALEQCKGKIPVREGYFSTMDLGADAGASGAGQFSDIEVSESDLDVVSEDEGFESDENENDAEDNDDENASRGKKRRGKRTMVNSANGSEAEPVLGSGRESLDEEDTDGEQSESEGEDDGGYGEGGLSWEAVMAQVMGGEEGKHEEDDSQDEAEDAPSDACGDALGSGRGVLAPGRHKRNKQKRSNGQQPADSQKPAGRPPKGRDASQGRHSKKGPGKGPAGKGKRGAPKR